MIPPRTIGSLFSGIGGLECGLEAATGARTVFQVEKEPFCREVLAKHYPDAVRHDDVCTVGAHNLTPVDVICGGFPCQDLSYAGKGAGLAGERSGLWREYRRIVGELRPRYVFVENVSALLGRGLGTVLGDLSSLGYDAVWTTLRASDVGAPHRRERLFILARAGRIGQCEPHYAEGTVSCEWDTRQSACGGGGTLRARSELAHSDGGSEAGKSGVSDSREPRRQPLVGSGAGTGGGSGRGRSPAGTRFSGPTASEVASGCGEGDQRQRGGDAVGDCGQVGVDLAHAGSGGPSGSRITVKPCDSATDREREASGSNHDGRGLAQRGMGRLPDGLSAQLDAHRWPAGPGEAQHEWEPPRVSKNCPQRAARLKALGNAVVPQVAALAWRVLFARMIATREAP